MAKRRVRIDDPPRLLRARPHSTDYAAIRRSMDEEGVPVDVREGTAVALAAEESGYTSAPGQALAGEPEAVSLEEQERQTRRAREKRERVVLSPLIAIDKELEKLEASGKYQNARLRFVRKILGEIGDAALARGTE